jgi:4,5:9,10-diseco-3-hydroxy-5,9,17-trioxoandrosta-1(10),2-diene-4-oate hydrolase
VHSRLTEDRIYPAGERDIHVNFIRTRSGLRVRAIDSGEPGHPPLVLLHGWACAVHVFRRNIPALVAAGYHVFAIDLKGHGLTDKPKSKDEYTLDAMTDFVLEALDALKLDRVSLVAQSLGGAIALQIALRAPERVERLALIAPAGLGRVRRLALLRSLASVALLMHAPRKLRRWMVVVALRRMFGELARPTSRDVDEYWAVSADPWYLRGLLTLVHEMDWTPLAPARLRAIRVPLLVIWGTKDRLLTRTHERDLPELIPTARVASVPGAGHACNEEAPDEINALLAAFLRCDTYAP